jgi:hypothetical protein
MIRKAVSVAVVFALVLCFSRASALGNSGSDSKEPVDKAPPAVAKKEANEKLKADVAKLVADAKAGKLKVPAQHFPQPKRNNLSTGAKIAIVAGIAGAIVFIILWYTTGPGSD